MMYLRWALSAPITFLFNLFCWVTAPIWGLMAAILKCDYLPWPFVYVQTHDSPIWGDGSDDDRRGMPDGFFGRWWVATRWIMRNPGYTFDAKVLGAKVDNLVELERWETKDHEEWDRGWSKKAWWLAQDRNTGRKYFSYRRDIPIVGRLYIKAWAGWNPKNLAGYHTIKIAFGPKFTKKD